MLEGLEISEVMLSAVHKITASSRLDAEFFQKLYLNCDRTLEKLGTKTLLEITSRIDVGFVGSMTQHYRDEGVPLIQTKNIDEFFVRDSDIVKITKDFHNALQKSKVTFEDILIARSGSFGKASIFLKSEETNSSDIIIIKAKNNVINPYFLTAFLNSKLGVNQMVRFASGGLQGHVNLTILEELQVPLLGKIFQQAIEALVKNSAIKIDAAKLSYKQAEMLLLDTLGMADFLPSAEGINIKSFKESFVTTGRLDAESYQPKYDQLRGLLECYAGGVTTIDELAGQIANGAEVREYHEAGVAYLRVGDLKGLTIDATSVVRIDPTSAEKGLEKIDLQAGDVLVSRSGSLAVTAVVEPEWADALISSHLIRLRITDARIDPYYLALFLGAVPGKMQIQQRSNGGVQPEINQPALKSILVPIPPQSAQQEIRRLILAARKLRDSSNNLLDVAKCAVEIAIEQDEAAGMAYIEANS